MLDPRFLKSVDNQDCEWWFPTLVDSVLAQRLREDYPQDNHLDDESILAKYEYHGKYATLWDHTGDATEQFEKLADAYHEIRNYLLGKETR